MKNITPSSIAFDIDGVVADTMGLFLDIARDEYHIDHISYDDITSYMLEECIDMESAIINEIIGKLLDGSYAIPLKPIQGAAEVLIRLGKAAGVLFVTARPMLGPIEKWMHDLLALNNNHIQIIATGSFKAKADVLVSRNISYFVEDRLETCFDLHGAGVTPILFKQPWNRNDHPFMEVGSWKELEALIQF